MKRLTLLVLALVALVSCQNPKAPKEELTYIVQVSLGSWDAPEYAAEAVLERLDSVTAKIPVGKVIIGWSKDKEIYREVGAQLHEKGIDMLLWLPVFAETEAVCDNAPSVDIWGHAPEHFDLKEGEGFRFNCPSDPENAQRIVALYDSLFADCGFDGVFLDRIRTQSFVGGISGVLSCGCPLCEARFAEESVDLGAIREAYAAEKGRLLSVSGYTPETGFVFENPLAADFFAAKGRIVSGAVAAIADSLRSRGLQVGMDLYAPFMAPFVGQDYAILSAHADFIKPMLYRMTNAPAGMGFEYAMLKSALPEADGYPDFPMDVAFLDGQLKAMEPYACGKFPGIEINYREGIAPTTPSYIRESLDAIRRHHFPGAVLSWNIMEVPEEHIQAL